jgi:hypothetical protein
MEYQQALQIGVERRFIAMVALSRYLNEKAVDVCAVRPAIESRQNPNDWQPVGQASFKEVAMARSQHHGPEAYLVVVDEAGWAKACSQRTYPVSIALQLAAAMPLPVYDGAGGALFTHIQEESMRKAQGLAQLPDL